MKQIFTIPNLLSCLRLLLIPFFCWTYIGLENVTITAILIAISGVTDLADGFIARKFNMISDLGKFLDPLADKLTLAAFLVCLITRFPYLLSLFALMFVKEITSSLLNLQVVKKTETVPMARWHGKIVTTSLYLLMAIHLVWASMPPVISYSLTGLVMSIMLLSFILYLAQNLRILRAAETKGDSH